MRKVKLSFYAVVIAMAGLLWSCNDEEDVNIIDQDDNVEEATPEEETPEEEEPAEEEEPEEEEPAEVAFLELPYSNDYQGEIDSLRAPFFEEGWLNVAAEGSRTWQVREYQDNLYLQANAYQSEEESNIIYLISPKIQFSDGVAKRLSFRSATNYGDDLTGFELLYSTDFDGTEESVASANWTELEFISSRGANNHEWISSGDVDLSAITEDAYVAFRYTGSDGNYTATYRIDDLTIEEGEVQPTPVLTVDAESIADFGSVDNGANSAVQTFAVSGEHISGEVTLTAPEYFELSTNGTDFSSEAITLTDLSVAQTISVRFSPASGTNGVKSGDILVSVGELEETVSVSGTEQGNDVVVVEVDLFFSEYAEGSSNNKYVEIYNPTGADVDLSNYRLVASSNGGDWIDENNDAERNIALSGTLAAGEVYVISTSDADQTILGKSSLTLDYASPVHFNGNDAIGLFKVEEENTVLIDVVGIPTSDDEWEVAGVSAGTQNHTLVRKSSVVTGTTDWATSAGTTEENSQWIVLESNDWTNIGEHTYGEITLD